MSFVIAEPEMVAAAAQNLAGIRSTLSQASAAAAGPTTGVVAAAEDQVSAAVAELFGSFGQDYQVLSAQAQAFHGEFVSLLGAGAGAYLATDAANAAAAGSIGGAYESLFTNTAANLQILSTTWTNVAAPALLQAITAHGNPQALLTALASGNLATTGRLARGYANLFQDLTVPLSVTVTSLNPPNASLAIGLGLPELLAFDALGAPVNAALAVSSSGTAILNAVQTGNPLAALTAFVNAPANIANAFLNGEQTLQVPLPVPGLSAAVPFSGLLVPVHPFTTTTSLPGNPLMQTVAVTGPPVGGFLPALLGYAPQLLASAFGS